MEKGIPYIKMYNLRKQQIDFYFHPQYIKPEVHNGKLQRSRTEVGDLIMNIVGPPLGKLAIIPSDLPESNFNQAAVLIRPYMHKEIMVNYLFYYLSEMSEINSISTKGSAGQVNISLTQSQNMRIALPPLNEQVRIVEEVRKWFAYVDSIDSNTCELEELVDKTKQSILKMAIQGELVRQNSSDESAINLLKRINPTIQIPCDNPHYQKLPRGWSMCRLEDVVDYEQPQAYIVDSTDYSDNYDTPVLTAGKSFVIGYTNENHGICDNLPVIIFDDFTTDSKFVDFPFKVKSSAMKILRPRKGINIKFLAYYMSITRLVGKTHKRYWISEYSKLFIPIPPYNEQTRIVNALQKTLGTLDDIAAIL